MMNRFPLDPGFICGFRWTGLEPAAPVGMAEALDALERAHPGEQLWLHFNFQEAEAQRVLRALPGLDPAFFEALQQGSRSSRIETSGRAMLAVLNDLSFDFGGEPSDVSTLVAQVTDRWIVTARLQPLSSVDRLRHAARLGKPLRSPMGVLTDLLEEQGHVLEGVIRNTTLQVDRIEDRLLEGKWSAQRRDLGLWRRLLTRVERWLAPEPGSMYRLMRHPPEWLSTQALEDLRQTTEELSLVLSDLASLKERIKLLQEELAAQVSEQSNRNLFALTSVTVMALPINWVAGLMGMNVAGLPMAEHPQGFWWVLGFTLVLTGLTAVVLRRRRDD